MQRLLIGVLVGVALVIAGGAWAYGSYRYGQLLSEWRWRNQVRGAKTAHWTPPVEFRHRACSLPG
jgi:hypothetical protein